MAVRDWGFNSESDTVLFRPALITCLSLIILKTSCFYAFHSYHLSKSLTGAITTQVQEILDGQGPHSKTKERQ